MLHKVITILLIGAITQSCTTSKKPELILNEIDAVSLPELNSVRVQLKNNLQNTIKIWENINPDGFLEVYFTFENEDATIKIIPIVLNWRKDFSKTKCIAPKESFEFNLQITNWTIDDSKQLPDGYMQQGVLKAFFKPHNFHDSTLWSEEISSNEVQVILKK